MAAARKANLPNEAQVSLDATWISVVVFLKCENSSF